MKSALPIIHAKDVWYTYPGSSTPSLRGISLDIEMGEFVLITGPSGCGKTTLCRCFNGLIPHFYGGTLRGELIVSGLKVTENPIHKLALHVGLVFQNPENQLFALSVEKDVAFGLENLGIDREEMKKRVDWALEATSIQDLRDRAPHELSGGQKQRVAIAGVLAMQPKILVLDEPTSFLDPLAAINIFEMLNKLNRELGITIVLVEHRLDLASRFIDRIIVMNEGSIVMDGDPKTIYKSEIIEKLGVGIPKVAQLFILLESMGVKIPEIPSTVNEASEILREVIKNDRG